MRRAIASLWVALLVLAAVPSLWGQVSTASLTGLVTDPTGAVIPDARVTAKNKATNIEQSTTTGASGYYIFPTLPVGNYEVAIEKEGFKRAVAEVVLLVAQKARQDFTLEVGAMAETVTVEATVPLLSTQEASTGAVVENRLVSDLPLQLRNWDDLLTLVAGVQGDRYTEEGGGTAAGRTGGVNVHGVRSLQNNFVLDGVDNNSISTNVQELSTQVARPSVDAMAEFKVVTNPYNTEFGRSPGAAISVTTKSGTNDLHGVVYWFVRNEDFDANTFMLNRVGRPQPKNRWNQFGFNVEGPVVKDRLFLFGNYEGTRISKGLTRTGSSPMPNERIGDFSAAAAAANRVTYATLIDRVGDCVGAGNPFPNNQIPAGCIDSVAAAILQLVPLPNFVPPTGAINVFNFIGQPNLIDDNDTLTIRGDWQVNDKNNVFVRYTYFDRFRFVPGVFGGVIDGTSTSAFGRLIMRGHSASIGWTSSITSRLVNEFRLGWGRNYSFGKQDPFGQLPPAAAIAPNTPTGSLFDGGVPGLRIGARGGTPTIPGAAEGGLDHLGSPAFLPKFQFTNQFQWVDKLSLTHGRHQMSFGVDVRLPLRIIQLDLPHLRGDLTFDGNRTGISMADFLLGYPSLQRVTNPAVQDGRLWMMSYFFQDDWKVTPKLTVNFGLRYDFATWPYEARNRMTNLNLATGERFTAAPFPGFASSTVGKSLVQSDKNNFAPRLGLAYQLTPETVIRAGYGRFFMLYERAGSEDQLGHNLPWLVRAEAGGTLVPTPATADNMRLQTGFTLSLDPTTIAPTKALLKAVNPEARIPSVDQWNFGIQRLLPGDIVATVDYVGTKGTHLSVLVGANQVFLNPDLTPSATIPFPSLGPIEFRDNMGNSNYHGLEATLEKRFSQGLAFRAAYTWSKSIDYTMEHLFSGGSGSFLQDAHNIRGDRRGPSDFDYRQRFVVSYVYELPAGRGRTHLTEGTAAHILGGWRISGVTNLRTGRPFTIAAGANSALVAGPRSVGLVQAKADCVAPARKIGSVDEWFDKSAFVLPVGRGGNCGRNTVYGPGAIVFDFAVARSFDYFGEGRNLEFRWEMFNMFNTPAFGLPNRDRSSGGFMQIRSLAADARVMQFALKFYF